MHSAIMRVIRNWRYFTNIDSVRVKERIKRDLRTVVLKWIFALRKRATVLAYQGSDDEVSTSKIS